MKNPHIEPISFSALGVACGAGFGKRLFWETLEDAPNLFAPLGREGRNLDNLSPRFIGCEIHEIPTTHLPARIERSLTFPTKVAVRVVEEAWQEANLSRYPASKIGLIVGACSAMAREQELVALKFLDRPSFIPPRSAHSFLDTEIAAVLCSCYPISGIVETINAASASGAAAIIQAERSIREGRVDACIVLGALQDLSNFNLHSMRALGAMNSEEVCASIVCRPMSFDTQGFVYGESCAALVLERESKAQNTYGYLKATGVVNAPIRGPEPDTKSQQKATLIACKQGNISLDEIDYINLHATGTPLGDKCEAQTCRELGLQHSWMNTTKSIIGHGLSSAGAIETAATLLQMKHGRIHRCRNLIKAVDEQLNFTFTDSRSHTIKNALKFSFGFGGINIALLIQNPQR